MPTPQAVQTGEIRAMPPAQTAKLIMLIVDDDTVDRRRLRRMARALDVPLDLEEASNLNTLCQKLDTKQFDIILLDYKLGAHDGLDAIRKIRNHRVNATTPVVMVTGSDDTDTAILSLKSGADDYLSKSQLTADLFANSVIEVLDSKERHDAISRQTEKRVVANAILSEISELCFEPMRPVLTRVLRQARALSAAEKNKLSLQTGLCLEEIERNCLTLWDYFEAFAEYKNRN